MSASLPATFSSGTVLVLGCGYVGRAVAEAALEQGCVVTALTRNPATAGELQALGVETIVADLATDGWHARAPRAPSLVVNCVAGGGTGIGGYRRAYLEGMQSVAAWMREGGAGTGVFVYTSSTSVYPQGDGAAVTEDDPTVPRGEETAAGILAATEGVVLGLPPPTCRRKVILRLAGIYGPSRVHLLDQVRHGAVSGRGDVHLNLVHRDDIVSAIASVLAARAENDSAGMVFNVADDGAALKSEIVSWLAGQLGVAPPVFTGAPLDGRQRVTPDRIIVNRRLKEACEWRPRYPTFREGYASILGAGRAEAG